MGKHATQGNSQVGHKNQTLKHGAKHRANQRIAEAATLASDVKIEYFSPIIGFDIPRKTAFEGINPVYGQDFTQTSATGYKLRVRDNEGRDCYVGISRTTVKPKEGKAFGVWVASYAGHRFPLLSNKGQALGFADAKAKLMSVLIIDQSVTMPARLTPAAKVVKAPKAYYGGGVEMAVCQVTLEPARVCDHCH